MGMEILRLYKLCVQHIALPARSKADRDLTQQDKFLSGFYLPIRIKTDGNPALLGAAPKRAGKSLYRALSGRNIHQHCPYGACVRALDLKGQGGEEIAPLRHILELQILQHTDPRAQ